MSKTPRLNSLAGLFLLVLIAVGSSACSFGSVTAQKPARDSETAAGAQPTSTPAYKPPKRVSRDVLDSDKKADKKDETVKSKTKK